MIIWFLNSEWILLNSLINIESVLYLKVVTYLYTSDYFPRCHGSHNTSFVAEIYFNVSFYDRFMRFNDPIVWNIFFFKSYSFFLKITDLDINFEIDLLECYAFLWHSLNRNKSGNNSRRQFAIFIPRNLFEIAILFEEFSVLENSRYIFMFEFWTYFIFWI